MRGCTCIVFLVAIGCADPGADDFIDSRPPAERHGIFYLHNGALGKIIDAADTRTGIEAADADCTNAAADRELGGSWRSWLSSSTMDACDRIDDAAAG